MASNPRPPFPDAMFRELGRIAVRWGAIEGLLADIIVRLIDAHPGRGYAVTQELSSARLIEIATHLTARFVADEGPRDALIAAIRPCENLRAERNRLLHGVWTTDGIDQGYAVHRTISWTRQHLIETAPLSVADIGDVAAEIEECFLDLLSAARGAGLMPP